MQNNRKKSSGTMFFIEQQTGNRETIFQVDKLWEK